jgi:hypothetical protein
MNFGATPFPGLDWNKFLLRGLSMHFRSPRPRRPMKDGLSMHPRAEAVPFNSPPALADPLGRNKGLVSPTRGSAVSAFTRVFDALWRWSAEQGPQI